MSRSFSAWDALFTVISRDAKASEAQPIAERGAAMTVAQARSQASAGDVQFYSRGETDPLCVYRLGERVFCRCENAADEAEISGFGRYPATCR